MKKTQGIEAEPVYSCEFCKSKFARERTLVSHLCEKKQRWNSRDNTSNRLGFQSWIYFYEKMAPNKVKHKTYEEFIKSPYYTAFVKFGSYCVEVNVVNILRFVDWLLKSNIRVDDWNSDKNYTKFLIDYIKVEDPFDALARGISYCSDLAEKERVQLHDCFRYISPNKICYAVTTGKISPWMLYQSDSGVQFLGTLNPDHINIINDYINPEQWALKFHREQDTTKQIKDTLKQAGF